MNLQLVSVCYLLGVETRRHMPEVDCTIDTRRLKRELIQDGADPYLVAAEALQTIERLKYLLSKYQRQYR